MTQIFIVACDVASDWETFSSKEDADARAQECAAESPIYSYTVMQAVESFQCVAPKPKLKRTKHTV